MGALTRWYQGKAAHADGDPDSTAYNYYAHDHLGSPRTTYSQGQAVLARIEFTPYGSPMTTTGQDMDLGYTGHKWDQETGSFYAPYRYYSPDSARWASRDPLGAAPKDIYSYAVLNPTNYIDPDGRTAVLIGAILGAGFGCYSGLLDAFASGNVNVGICGCLGGAASGAVSGAITSSGAGIWASALGNTAGGAVGGMVQCMCDRALSGKSNSLTCCAGDALAGAGGGLAGWGLGNRVPALGGSAGLQDAATAAAGGGLSTLGAAAAPDTCCE